MHIVMRNQIVEVLLSYLRIRTLGSKCLLSNEAQCPWYVNLRRNCSSNVQDMTKVYDNEQLEKILTTINSGTEEDLVRFSLGRQKARKLSKFVEQNGHLNHLDQILPLLDIGQKAFTKFCDSVLHDTVTKLRPNNFISPVTSTEHLNLLPSVVGLSVGVDFSLTWAQVSSTFELEDWDHTVPTTPAGKKSTPFTLFDTVEEVCDQLPKSNAFILEAMPALLPQQVYMPSYIQRREVQAMLIALLNSRPPRQHRVYFLRSRLTSRLYSIQVGSERVSAQPLVDRLLNGCGIGPSDSTYLQVRQPELEAIFRSQRGPQKEAKASALLNALAFLKLAVHEDPICFKALRLQ